MSLRFVMNRVAYTEIWFINNFMLSPARDGSVTAFCKPMLGVRKTDTVKALTVSAQSSL